MNKQIGQSQEANLLYEIIQRLDRLIKLSGNSVNGVYGNSVIATLSDSTDLVNPGYIQPRLLAGNIKVTDMGGNISTLAFDQKEVSLFKVKRVWSTGTTANMGIVVLY